MNEKEKVPGKGNKPDEQAQAIDATEAESIFGETVLNSAYRTAACGAL